jgi:hypothetical protein
MAADVFAADAWLNVSYGDHAPLVTDKPLGEHRRSKKERYRTRNSPSCGAVTREQALRRTASPARRHSPATRVVAAPMARTAETRAEEKAAVRLRSSSRTTRPEPASQKNEQGEAVTVPEENRPRRHPPTTSSRRPRRRRPLSRRTAPPGARCGRRWRKPGSARTMYARRADPAGRRAMRTSRQAGPAAHWVRGPRPAWKTRARQPGPRHARAGCQRSGDAGPKAAARGRRPSRGGPRLRACVPTGSSCCASNLIFNVRRLDL